MSRSPDNWPERFQEAHQSIAAYFGVSRPEQILLTPGCTSALAVGISDAWIPAGRRVLTSHWEHHAVHRPLLKLASSGVAVEYIPLGGESKGRPTSPLNLDWLDEELSKGDVALVAITAACNVTGELLPFEDVIRMVHQHGSYVLLDAAQIVGWLKLDFVNLGADFVAFGGHKGLQAPWGIGGLFISESVRMTCASATCELPAAGTDSTQPFSRPGYCDVGSVDQLALAGLHAAIGMLEDRNTTQDLAHARWQIQKIRRTLEAIDGVSVLNRTKPEQQIPSLAFNVQGRSSGEVALLLKQHSILVGSGIQCSPLSHETLGTQASGAVRLSVGIGQTDEEIDEAIARMEPLFVEDLSSSIL